LDLSDALLIPLKSVVCQLLILIWQLTADDCSELGHDGSRQSTGVRVL